MLMMLLASVVVACLTAQTANIPTTIFLHRFITHQAFELKRTSEMTCRTLIWLLTNVYPREWGGLHRKHHAFTDIPGDPHSPLLEGFWHIQLFNPYYYAVEAKRIDLNHWAKGIPEYWMDRHMLLGQIIAIVSLTALMILIASFVGVSLWWGLLFGPVTMFFHGLFYNLLSATVNGLCHYRGYKNYQEAEAYNNRLVALLTFGEGLHNNHHKHQRSPKLSTKHRRFEFDPAWPVIWFLDKIGQIKNKSEYWHTRV